MKNLSTLLLFVVLTPQAQAMLDLDGNGISDVWQSLYSAAVLDADTDSDFDGQTDLAEGTARTNPFDSLSFLKLTIAPAAAPKADSHFLLEWPSATGLEYAVHYSDTLTTLNPGTPLSGYHLGIGATTALEVEKGADKRFWRVSTSGVSADEDGDLLDIWEETQLGSDASLADSDLDGTPDGKDFAYLAGPTTYSPAGLGVPTSGALAGQLVRYQKDGTPVAIRAFGVNYYDGFLRYIQNDNDRSFVQGFEYLANKNIPVARVLIGGFWPSDWNLYFSDKAEYYRRLDDFVEQAERNEIGLIPVLFWHFASIGDVVDDAVSAGYITPHVDAATTPNQYDFVPPSPLNQDSSGNDTYDEYRKAMGLTDSGTRALITYVTEEVVNRYRGSPAIWGWEFSNELNLNVDLPNPVPFRPTVKPAQGKDLARDGSEVAAYESEDDFVRADVQAAKEHFAATVRALDPWRFISSGDSRPRTRAYFNWQSQTWGSRVNTRAELAQVLTVDNPAGYDSLSIHVYAQGDNYFSDAPSATLDLESGANQGEELADYTNFFSFFMAESVAQGRPLFVGEWGAIGNGTTQSERDTYHSLMQSLIDSEVQLSLLWTFDNRNTGHPAHWWVNPGTAKEYQLTNEDPNLWDLEQVNAEFGVW